MFAAIGEFLLKFVVGWIWNKFSTTNPAEKLGKLEVTAQAQKETLDEIQKSKDARDNINSDPAVAARVRELYSRPDK
jgi:hypothetical protein